MKIDKKQVGIRIHELRTQNNWSMEELANKIKASGKSTINEWEKGRTMPSKKFLERLAKIFTVSTDYIKFGYFDEYLLNLTVKILETDPQPGKKLGNLTDFYYLKYGEPFTNKWALSRLLELKKINDINTTYNRQLDRLKVLINEYCNRDLSDKYDITNEGDQLNYNNDIETISKLDKFFYYETLLEKTTFTGSIRDLEAYLDTLERLHLSFSSGLSGKNNPISIKDLDNYKIKKEIEEGIKNEDISTEQFEEKFTQRLLLKVKKFEKEINSLNNEYKHFKELLKNNK